MLGPTAEVVVRRDDEEFGTIVYRGPVDELASVLREALLAAHAGEDPEMAPGLAHMLLRGMIEALEE